MKTPTRKIITAALTLAAALTAGCAFAGSDSTTVNIGGSIGAGCTAYADPVALGIVRSADARAGVPVTVTLHVNCTAGVPYAISVPLGTPRVSIAPSVNAELQGHPSINGVELMPTGMGGGYTNSGTGSDTVLAVTGTRFATDQQRATGPISATFTSAYVISY